MWRPFRWLDPYTNTKGRTPLFFKSRGQDRIFLRAMEKRAFRRRKETAPISVDKTVNHESPGAAEPQPNRNRTKEEGKT
jgi:hypothetical protein